MCGLAGVAARYVQEKHRNIFQQLLLGAQLRGIHATGAAIVYRDYQKSSNHFAMDKTLGVPQDLFDRRGWTNMMAQNSTRVMIGHCRHGTIGGNVRSNAHPFITDSRLFIGAHNGTIQSKLPDQIYYGTDSECLLNNIEDNGPEFLKDVEGAWALTWFDGRDMTLNIIRNDQRTLYLARQIKDDELYWSSEEGLLRWILDRNNIKDYELFLLKPDLLLKFKVFEPNFLSKENLTLIPIKGKEESRVASTTHFLPAVIPQAATQAPTTISVNSSENTTESKTTTTLEGQSEGDYIEITDDVWVSPFAYKEMLKKGCFCCERIKTVKDEVKFHAANVYLCAECEANPKVVEALDSGIDKFLDGDEFDMFNPIEIAEPVRIN